MPGPWDEPKPPLRTPAPRKASRLGFYLWLGILIGAGALLLGLNRIFPSTDAPLGDPGVVQTIGFLVLASSSLLFMREFNLKRTARNILLWLALGTVLILGFIFKNELMDFGIRLRGALIPSYAIQTGAREMTLSEGEDGHYHVYGVINGVKVYFLIDTGASDIVLDPEDARRIGLKLEDLTFDKPFGSANGVGTAPASRWMR